MKIKFTKLQALGNDYIYIDSFKQNLTGLNLRDLARKVTDRHFGVGGDGLIIIRKGRSAPFKMEFYNPDGTPAQMCGNGVRCFARYVCEHGLCRKRKIEIETKDRIIEAEVLKKTGEFIIKVDMGEPVLERKKIPVSGKGKFCINEEIKVDNRTVRITSVSMGNPHTLILVDRFEDGWQKLGAMVEKHPIFPEKTNVEFVSVLNRKKIQLHVWERSAGETMASGTGASAGLVACVLNNKTDREVLAYFQAGCLKVSWDEKNNHIYVIGPTEEVFSGTYEYKS
ncbi:MAG TPA: diaminopimelate epimerase [Terriglobales bacterium]|nr:diaminopimelate epimerase [Terriglobales bacterium]